MKRHLTSQVLEDLQRKMVLLSGPRQCGKTTFARSLFTEDETQYLNWDQSADRKVIGYGRLDVFDQ